MIIWLAANRVDIKGASHGDCCRTTTSGQQIDQALAVKEVERPHLPSALVSHVHFVRCSINSSNVKPRSTVSRDASVMCYRTHTGMSQAIVLVFHALPLGCLTPSNTHLEVPVLFLITLAIIRNISPQILLLFPIMSPSRFQGKWLSAPIFEEADACLYCLSYILFNPSTR